MIYALPEWEQSNGIIEEIEYASNANKAIIVIPYTNNIGNKL